MNNIKQNCEAENPECNKSMLEMTNSVFYNNYYKVLVEVIKQARFLIAAASYCTYMTLYAKFQLQIYCTS